MIEVYTANTPNGIKVPLVLEELGVPYRVIAVNLNELEQKSDSFLAINPNGRIPAIVDTDKLDEYGNPQTVFESGAILLYLAEKYRGLLGESDQDRIRALEWLFFQMGGVGPMFGQANFFSSTQDYPSENALRRFRVESERLATVLESRLAKSPWLAGDHYTIADIANYSWLRYGESAGIDLELFPSLENWRSKVESRLAVHRAVNRIQNPDQRFAEIVSGGTDQACA